MFIEQVFSLLKGNKELPYYQAERRMDIFFNIFLGEILNHFLHKKNIVYVSPEFPLKKQDSRLSTKVDYLCFDTAEKIIYFVELKTDDKSYRNIQYETYSGYDTWRKCTDDLLLISAKQPKAYREKFNRLKDRLQSFGLLSADAADYQIRIVYIAPNKQKNCCTITFKDLNSFTPNRFQEEWSFFKNYLLIA